MFGRVNSCWYTGICLGLLDQSIILDISTRHYAADRGKAHSDNPSIPVRLPRSSRVPFSLFSLLAQLCSTDGPNLGLLAEGVSMLSRLLTICCGVIGNLLEILVNHGSAIFRGLRLPRVNECLARDGSFIDRLTVGGCRLLRLRLLPRGISGLGVVKSVRQSKNGSSGGARLVIARRSQ